MRSLWRLLVVVALLGATVLVDATLGGSSAAQVQPAPTASTRALPPIKHVWVIVLENEDYQSTFGDPSADPYLARTLPSEGALLKQYYATGHESNDNYLALVSGQPPNPMTQGDCQIFTGFPAGHVHDGIEQGIGCVYPKVIRTIGAQLDKHRLSWKAYEQGMGNDPSRESAACGHPTLDTTDGTQTAVAGDGYAARHDPFVYFESVIGNRAYCDKHVVALGTPSGAMPASALRHETGLVTDLRTARTTPAYSFITPDLCSDGHDHPCKNRTGKATQLQNIDTFLKNWVPRIQRSPAYRDGGLIDITFDESDGAQSDSRACCGEVAGKSSPLPGITGPGGGRIGTVLLSPYISPGTVSTRPYNHYSALASIEKLFGMSALGMARGVPRTFGADIFTAWP